MFFTVLGTVGKSLAGHYDSKSQILMTIELPPVKEMKVQIFKMIKKLGKDAKGLTEGLNESSSETVMFAYKNLMDINTNLENSKKRKMAEEKEKEDIFVVDDVIDNSSEDDDDASTAKQMEEENKKLKAMEEDAKKAKKRRVIPPVDKKTQIDIAIAKIIDDGFGMSVEAEKNRVVDYTFSVPDFKMDEVIQGGDAKLYECVSMVLKAEMGINRLRSILAFQMGRLVEIMAITARKEEHGDLIFLSRIENVTKLSSRQALRKRFLVFNVHHLSLTVMLTDFLHKSFRLLL